MTIKAIDVAKWFIKNKLDSPRNTYEGNMKLQKLLYFAQLIHVAKYDELLFDDEMRAYRDGSVINNVRLPYRDQHYRLIKESYEFEGFDNELVVDTLELTAEIFGDMTPKELSKLNHELDSWTIPYNESIVKEEIYSTNKNIINPSDKIFMDDVNRVKDMLEVYLKPNNKLMSTQINGATFYYDPDNIEITEDVLNVIENSEFPEDVYSLTYDEEQGVIIS